MTYEVRKFNKKVRYQKQPTFVINKWLRVVDIWHKNTISK